MGRMTNAKYIVAGNILKVAGLYTVTFRVNDAATNEIKASFNKQYTAIEIEKGLAAKEAVAELLAGIGVELTSNGETELLTIQETQVRATTQLAKGMAAEKNDNFVEALAFFTQAADSGVVEASSHIQNFAKDISTGSIRERAEYAVKQKEKWEKIFRDLETYVYDNFEICIYDFSTVEDEIRLDSSNRTTVSFRIKPGIKLIPNRTVLAVWKTVMDNWDHACKLEENKPWVDSVRNYRIRIGRGDGYAIEVGLYDEYGDRISVAFFHSHLGYGYSPSFQVIAQHKYYEEIKFSTIYFYNISIDRITNNLTPKIDKITSQYNNKRIDIHPPIMSVPEWEQWLREQQGD
jgi:hypothetical protein